MYGYLQSASGPFKRKCHLSLQWGSQVVDTDANLYEECASHVNIKIQWFLLEDSWRMVALSQTKRVHLALGAVPAEWRHWAILPPAYPEIQSNKIICHNCCKKFSHTNNLHPKKKVPWLAPLATGQPPAQVPRPQDLNKASLSLTGMFIS